LKKALVLFAMAITVPLLAATFTNRPIAKAGTETIFMSDFQKTWGAFVSQQEQSGMPKDKMDTAWKTDNQQKLLNQMVEDKILLGEAKKRKIKVNQRDFENGLLQVKARFLPDAAQKQLQTIVRRQMGGPNQNPDATPDLGAAWKEMQTSNAPAIKEAEATFKKELEKENMDEKKFSDRLRDQLSVVQLSSQEVRGRVKPPSDAEIKKLFGRVSAQMSGEKTAGLSPQETADLESMAKYYDQQTAERVKARHILFSILDDKGQPLGWEKASVAEKTAVRKKAEEILKKIKTGGDFSELAKENSDDKGSGARGGDLGFFTRGQMVPAFDKAAFSLPVGGLSGLVETPFGLHIIRVDEKKASEKLKLEDAEDDLREYLFRASQQEAFESFVKDLRKTTNIQILVKPEELAEI